jgi:hypothetical protein
MAGDAVGEHCKRAAASAIRGVTLTALTPGEILLAKGLSCSLPFLAIAVAYTLGDVLTLLLVRVPAMQEMRIPASLMDFALGGSTEFARKLYIFSMYVGAFLTPVALSARAAILVCVSAFCKRVATAVVLVFAVVLVAEPAVRSAVSWIVGAVMPWNAGLRALISLALLLALQVAVLRLLIPLALKAIDPNRSLRNCSNA